MISTETLIKTLCGPIVLKRGIATLQDLHRLVEAGLLYAALEKIMHRFQLDRCEVEFLLQVPARTMARRKRSRSLEWPVPACGPGHSGLWSRRESRYLVTPAELSPRTGHPASYPRNRCRGQTG